MRKIYIVSISDNSEVSENRYFADRSDAIIYVNARCDIYRTNWVEQRVILIYEPDRDMWESGAYCPQYYSEIQFQDRRTLRLTVKSAPLY